MERSKQLALGAICCGVTIAVGCGSANDEVVDETTTPSVHEDGYLVGGGFGTPIYAQPPVPPLVFFYNPIFGYGGGGGGGGDAGVRDSAADSGADTGTPNATDGGIKGDAAATDAGATTDSAAADAGSTNTACTAAGEACLFEGTPGSCVDSSGGWGGYTFYTCAPSGPTTCTRFDQRCYNGTEFGVCRGGTGFGYYCVPDSACLSAGDTCLTTSGAPGYCFATSLFGGYQCEEAIACTAVGEACFDAAGWGTCQANLSGAVGCVHTGGLYYGGGGGGGFYYESP